jgi:hypothetical protein
MSSNLTDIRSLCDQMQIPTIEEVYETSDGNGFADKAGDV